MVLTFFSPLSSWCECPLVFKISRFLTEKSTCRLISFILDGKYMVSLDGSLLILSCCETCGITSFSYLRLSCSLKKKKSTQGDCLRQSQLLLLFSQLQVTSSQTLLWLIWVSASYASPSQFFILNFVTGHLGTLFVRSFPRLKQCLLWLPLEH